MVYTERNLFGQELDRERNRDAPGDDYTELANHPLRAPVGEYRHALFPLKPAVNQTGREQAGLLIGLFEGA